MFTGMQLETAPYRPSEELNCSAKPWADRAIEPPFLSQTTDFTLLRNCKIIVSGCLAVARDGMFLSCSPPQVSKAAPSSIVSFDMQLLTRQQHPWSQNFILRTARAELQQLSGHKSRLFSRAVNLGQGTHGLGADYHSPQRFPTPQST